MFVWLVADRVAGGSCLGAIAVLGLGKLGLRPTSAARPHVKPGFVGTFRRCFRHCGRSYLLGRCIRQGSDGRRDEGRKTGARLLLSGRLAKLALLANRVRLAALPRLTIVAILARLTIVPIAVPETAVIEIAGLAVVAVTAILPVAVLAPVAVLPGPVGIAAVLRVSIVAVAILPTTILLSATLLSATIAIVGPSILPIIVRPVTPLSIGVLVLTVAAIEPLASLWLTGPWLAVLGWLAILRGLPFRLAIGQRRGRRHLRDAFARRREAIWQSTEIVVVLAIILFELVAGLALIPELGLLLRLLRRSDQAEIMLCVLQITLGHDRIAGRLRVASELEILFANVVGSSPDLHIRPIGLVGACKRVGAFAVGVVAVAPTHTLVLTRSHR